MRKHIILLPGGIKRILAALVLSFTTLLTGLIFTFKMGFIFSLGFAGMYFIYEVTHRRFHIREPLIRYGLRMRKHHFYHHFGNPNVNYWCDYRTLGQNIRHFPKTYYCKSSQKVAMTWLKDNNQQLKPKYQRHFNMH
ncbi:MAG: hypothetical protein U0T77_05740 [Chitinophagales bacterium]